MEFLSISQVQAIVNDSPYCYVEDEEQEQEQKMPGLMEEGWEAEREAEREAGPEQEQEQVTKDPMEYIDHMFMVCGFVRLSEKPSITDNCISRMYSSRTGLCVSLKCGVAYKCSFLYDDKINYIYPATQDLMDYVSRYDDEIGFADTFKLIEPSKIFPETFEIVVFKQDTKPLSEHTIDLFEKKFLNCTNTSVSASGSTIIITYAPICCIDKTVSVESFVKFLNPSY